jgi:hypothetical protein
MLQNLKGESLETMNHEMPLTHTRQDAQQYGNYHHSNTVTSRNSAWNTIKLIHHTKLLQCGDIATTEMRLDFWDGGEL